MSGLGFTSGGPGAGGGLSDPAMFDPFVPGGGFAGISVPDIQSSVEAAIGNAAATILCSDLSSFAFGLRQKFNEGQPGDPVRITLDFLAAIASVILNRTDCSDAVKQEAIRILDGGTPQASVEAIDPTAPRRTPTSGSINQPAVEGSAQDPLGRIAPVFGATQTPAPTAQTLVDKLFKLAQLWAQIFMSQQQREAREELTERQRQAQIDAANAQAEFIQRLLAGLVARGAQMPFGQAGFAPDTFDPGGGTIGSSGGGGFVENLLTKGLDILQGVLMPQASQPIGVASMLPAVIPPIARALPTVGRAVGQLGAGAALGEAIETGLQLFGGGGNGGGGGAAAGQLFHTTAAGNVVPTSLVMATNPKTGKATFFQHAGRPILYAGDLRACKRVKKAGARARRASGGRR